MVAENQESLFMLLWSPTASQFTSSHVILPSNFPLWCHVIVEPACCNLMSEANAFIKCLQKCKSLTLHHYEMVSSTCELTYMVWLAQRTTNMHGILKLKFQVPWIRKFPDQTRNSQKIRFLQQCWWREKSQICLTPEDTDLQLSTQHQRNPHTKHSPSLWHHLPLPAPTSKHVGAVGWVGYINLANQANRKWQLRAKVKVKFTLQPAMKE